ncbi:MAG TPA: hypothetical protein VEB21_05035, partial [Terriglobales bacterium]|nr:hypothetical protein [Terriglobales bacterium]
MRLRPSWVLVGSYWLGACLGLALLSSLLPTALDPLVGVLGGVATAAWWCWWTKPAGWLVALSLLLVAATWALWLYLAIAFGVLLAWTLPPWGWLLCLLLALVAAASQLRPPQRRFLHPLLPLGLWIVLVLAGWPREEELLRCDDYLALSPGAELV